jgi:hypothetical protein
MTAYFDKINKWTSEQGADSMTPEERVALIDRVERAVTWDLFCTMDFEFPADLREKATTIISRYPIAPQPLWCRESDYWTQSYVESRRWAKVSDVLADSQWEKDRLDRVEAVEDGLLFVASFVHEVHELMHEVAGRRIETRWGILCDSLDQNLKSMDLWLADKRGESYDLFPHKLIHDHPLRAEIMSTAANFGRDTALIKLGIEGGE